MENNEEFYTSQEIADKLKINIMTVYRHINSGKLKAIKTGKDFRVLKSDFEDYLQSNQQRNVLEEKDNKILFLEKTIAKLKNNIKKERYGLNWFDVPEAFEDDVEHKLPILKEDQKMAIGTEDDQPTHILIEGDNYHALTCLNYTHKEKIDIVYIDPPYNTGSDGFRYKDKRILDKFPDGTDVPVDHPFRQSYWLSFMKKRLDLTYDLMKKDGLLAVSIDDNEYAQLKLLLAEKFGDSIKTIVVKMSEASGLKMASIKKSGGIPKYKEYLLLAMKDGIRNLSFDFIPKEIWDNEYNLILENFSYNDYQEYLNILDNNNLAPKTATEHLDEIFQNVKIGSLAATLKSLEIPKNELSKWLTDNSWRICRSAASSSVKRLADVKRMDSKQQIFSVNSVRDNILYLVKGDYDDDSASPRVQLLLAIDNLSVHPGDLWTDIKTTGLEAEGGVEFKNGKKPLALLKRIISSINDKNAVILDFFAGSGTTGEAVMELNHKDKGRRQFILVTNNEGGIMTEVCHPRMVNSVKKYNGSIKYYKTAFVGENNILNSTDQDKLELAYNAGELLAIAENTLYEQKKNEFYQIFKDNNRYTAIYFREEMDKYDEFIQEVKKLKADEISVYIFSWESDETIYEFEDMKNIRIKTIPQPIVEIYKQIYNLV